MKVLTVDDSKTIRMIVKKAFTAYDCEIFEAENGVEGLALAGKVKPSLIILDITMPVMNGIEMLDRMKADGNLKNIPVIMLTAESGRDNVLQIVQKGVNDYMVKPFRGEDLIERVRKIVPLEPRADGDDGGAGKIGRYFRKIEDATLLTLPGRVTRPVSLDIDTGLQESIKEMSGQRHRKMILDMARVGEMNVSLIRLIIAILRRCQEADVAVKVVAKPKQGEELKGFHETSNIGVLHSVEEARAALSAT